MKINEVENLIGISKKNIRFYEDQGLLSPTRNADNGYRSYSDEDIKLLEQIKLFRKLGVPIDEIRNMQAGNSTVSDCINRHLVSLRRKQSNLENAIELCTSMKNSDILLDNLDANHFLKRMDEMEHAGTSFKNIHKNDVKVGRYAGAFFASFITVLFVSAMLALIVWAYKTTPEESPPLWFIITLAAVMLAVIFGVLYALIQRICEIQKGEIEDAREF